MSAEHWLPWLSAGLVVLGLVVMTIGVAGIVRLPDIFTKLHAASKSTFLGVCAILAAVAAAGDPAFTARVILIGVLLLLTTPVAAYEIARASTREPQLDSHAVFADPGDSGG